MQEQRPLAKHYGITPVRHRGGEMALGHRGERVCAAQANPRRAISNRGAQPVPVWGLAALRVLAPVHDLCRVTVPGGSGA